MLGTMTKEREGEYPTELGRFIAVHRGRTSVRRAAALTEPYLDKPLSEGRWRQIEAGFEAKGGMRFPVNPKAETVAAMCRAIGADVSKGLEMAGFDPSEYADLTEVAALHVSTGDLVRDGIETSPLLDDRGRATVLAIYDAEVAREAEHRRRTG